MSKNYNYLILFLFILFSIMACQKEVDLPTNESEIPVFTPEEAAVLSKYVEVDKFRQIPGITDQMHLRRIQLGRVLFYDKDLSADRTISCGSCHLQHKGFADDKKLSEGVFGRKTSRNSLSLVSFPSFANHYNGGFSFVRKDGLFWDERVPTINHQLNATFRNPDEMGMEYNEIGKRAMEKEELYSLFLDRKVNSGTYVIELIRDFVHSIIVDKTLFDEGFQETGTMTKDFKNFTDQENVGMRIFEKNCSSCHAFSFNSHLKSAFAHTKSTTCNGLDVSYEDKGVGGVTRLSSDNGVFKIPGLKNIELTGPYMHDGRFETLEEVVAFYNSEIKNHQNLDERLKSTNGAPIKLNLSTSEQQALVAFLKTLTDHTLLNNVNLSNPFLE